MLGSSPVKKPCATSRVLVDDNTRRWAVRHGELRTAGPQHRPQYRIKPSDRPLHRECIGDQRVDTILPDCGRADDARKQRDLGIRYAPFLKTIGFDQRTQPVTDKLIYHRLRIVPGLLTLKQRLYRGDA